jgi:hypothetical protein
LIGGHRDENARRKLDGRSPLSDLRFLFADDPDISHSAVTAEALPESSSGRMRIPMMSISHSDLMPISSERSDAGLSQCESVIDIRQGFLAVS